MNRGILRDLNCILIVFLLELVYFKMIFCFDLELNVLLLEIVLLMVLISIFLVDYEVEMDIGLRGVRLIKLMIELFFVYFLIVWLFL